ncbi:Uncharacterized protein TCM_011337 [Theobroma cacao]|uniref:Secreted protein n=1 Tax=Theobroma cacao TaxID=3641 RepID=A0A061EAN0_THECC|nr:Uncharacterized protein TCM_011337 [Theobroma cacao]
MGFLFLFIYLFWISNGFIPLSKENFTSLRRRASNYMYYQTIFLVSQYLQGNQEHPQFPTQKQKTTT